MGGGTLLAGGGTLLMGGGTRLVGGVKIQLAIKFLFVEINQNFFQRNRILNSCKKGDWGRSPQIWCGAKRLIEFWGLGVF